MIVGIGNDLVDLRRLQQFFLRHPRLPQRVLTTEERREFSARGCALTYLGGRIAAKEALAKALQTGMRTPLGWQKVWTLNGDNGAPILYYSPPLKNYLQQRGVAVCHISITHHGDYAAASVVAEAR